MCSASSPRPLTRPLSILSGISLIAEARPGAHTRACSVSIVSVATGMFSFVCGIHSYLFLIGFRFCSRPNAIMLAMPELMHVGSLIVDDIQDRSDTRRGGPSWYDCLPICNHVCKLDYTTDVLLLQSQNVRRAYCHQCRYCGLLS